MAMLSMLSQRFDGTPNLQSLSLQRTDTLLFLFYKHDKEHKKKFSSRNVLRRRPTKGHRICHACT